MALWLSLLPTAFPLLFCLVSLFLKRVKHISIPGPLPLLLLLSSQIYIGLQRCPFLAPYLKPLSTPFPRVLFFLRLPCCPSYCSIAVERHHAR